MRKTCDRVHLCPPGAGKDRPFPGAPAAPFDLRARVDRQVRRPHAAQLRHQGIARLPRVWNLGARLRILRFLKRRGVITLVTAPGDGEVTVVTDETMGEKDPLLARLLAAATAGASPAGPAHKRAPVRIVLDPDAHPVAKGKLCGQHGGFNLHAQTKVAANEPSRPRPRRAHARVRRQAFIATFTLYFLEPAPKKDVRDRHRLPALQNPSPPHRHDRDRGHHQEDSQSHGTAYLCAETLACPPASLAIWWRGRRLAELTGR
jgi:hypothetical protein